MWVLTGPFDGDDSEELQALKQKLLKPGKKYISGRKEQDLVIRHKKISRDHAHFEVGTCTDEQMADPDFVPKLWITVTPTKATKTSRHLIRPGRNAPYVLNPGEQVELEPGDIVQMATGVNIDIKWEKICCYVTQPAGLPSTRACADLGISLVLTPHPTLTHHLAPSYSLTPEIATSLLSVATIVKPDWLKEVVRLGKSETEGGLSQLEQHFSLPLPEKYKPTFSPALPSTLKMFAKWAPDEARANMLSGYRFIFMGEKGREVSEAMRELVKRGRGEYECFAVESGRQAWHQLLAKGKGKNKNLVLVGNEDALVPAIGDDKWQELVEEARSFKLSIIPRETVLEAVVHVDTLLLSAPPSVDGSSLPDVIMNTHPDEPSVPPESVPESSESTSQPTTRTRRLPRRAASRASPLPPKEASEPEPAKVDTVQEPESSAHKPRRPLVRRARQAKQQIIGIDDPSVELDGNSLSQAPVGVPGNAHDDLPPVPPTPSRRPLTRRARTAAQTPSIQLFDQVTDSQGQTQPSGLERHKLLFLQSDPDRIAQSELYKESQSGHAESMTQDDTGLTQTKPQSGVRRNALAAVPEEEEESISGVGGSVESGTVSLQTQGTKRKSCGTDDDGDVEMGEETRPRLKRRAIQNVDVAEPTPTQSTVEKPQSKATSKPKSTQTTVGRSETQKSKSASGAAPGEPDTDAAFLKAVASTKRGQRAEDTFDREFNNLRISKPDLNRDQEQDNWAVLEEFGDDGDVRGNFMVVVEMDVYRKDSGENRGMAIRMGGGRQDWEGRPDFKKFKKKATGKRQTVELCVEENDYGMSSQYWKGVPPLQTQTQSQSQDESMPVLEKPTQPRKGKSKTQTQPTQKKGKGRAPSIILSDDDDEMQPTPPPKRATQARTRSTQARGKNQPLFLDSDDEDAQSKAVMSQALAVEDDDDDGDVGISAQNPGDTDEEDELTLRSTAAKTQSVPARKSRRTAVKRAAAVIADDDSDDGATFKGFGARKRARRY